MIGVGDGGTETRKTQTSRRHSDPGARARRTCFEPVMIHTPNWKWLLVLVAAAGAGCADAAEASGPYDDARRATKSPMSQSTTDRTPCRDGGDASTPEDVVTDGGADSDASCACTPGGTLGKQSLPCFCAIDPCPSYEEAIDLCPPSPFPEENRIDTYGDCNLVVIEYSFGFDYGRYVYDATTHALVGGMYATDYDAYTCGSTRVFGIRAGTFPASTCTVTQSALRCADGGRSSR